MKNLGRRAQLEEDKSRWTWLVQSEREGLARKWGNEEYDLRPNRRIRRRASRVNLTRKERAKVA